MELSACLSATDVIAGADATMDAAQGALRRYYGYSEFGL